MKKCLMLYVSLCLAIIAIAQEVLVIPYDATGLTNEQRNANPDYVIFPLHLDGVDEVGIICNPTTVVNAEAIDLGLTSGLKWASCNVGAAIPEEYGDYFAWGETQTKDYFEWETYKYYSDDIKLTKYCTDIEEGIIDYKTILEPMDDAATVNWGENWRIPTIEEWVELRDNCTWTWTTQNSVNGYMILGTNGNSIFLPATGGYEFDVLDGLNVGGGYWSSMLKVSYPVCALDIEISTAGIEIPSYYCERQWGRTIRPVCP